MASSIPSDVVPSNQDEIASSSAVDADIESPPSLENSEMVIDESRQGDDGELQDEDAGYLPMLPPTIERHEVELPLLTKVGEESELPRDFGSEIPDSEAVSDWSSIIDGGKHECGETDCGVPSNTSPAQEVPSQLGLSNAIVPKALDVETEGEVMEQKHPSNQLVEPSVTTDFAPEQANVSSQLKSETPKADGRLLDDSPIEDNDYNNERNIIPKTLKTGVGDGLCTEAMLKVPDKVKPPLGSLDSEMMDSQTIRVSSDERSVSHVNVPRISEIELAENPLVEVDMPATTVEAGSMSPINDQTIINESKMATSPPNPIESVTNLSRLEADEASPISSEKQDTSIASTGSSSPHVKTQEGNSTHTKQMKPPSTPFKGPVPSQNNDIMVTELKAMKIVGGALFYFPSLYSEFSDILKRDNNSPCL